MISPSVDIERIRSSSKMTWETVYNSYKTGPTYCFIQRTSPVYTVENDPSKTVIASVDLEYEKVYYDGTAKTPSVTVKDLDGNVLVKDEDYTVTYSDNTNLTTYAKVTVEGINANGVYGTYIKYFKIEQEPVAEKTKVLAIEGTTNIAELVKYGEPVTNPSITITKGSPAEYNNAGTMNWMKKQGDGSWKNCKNEDVFTEGEYRLSCRFGVYNSNFNEYVLDDSATVKLDSTTWEISSKPGIYSSYSAMIVLSPI